MLGVDEIQRPWGDELGVTSWMFTDRYAESKMGYH